MYSFKKYNNNLKLFDKTNVTKKSKIYHYYSQFYKFSYYFSLNLKFIMQIVKQKMTDKK